MKIGVVMDPIEAISVKKRLHVCHDVGGTTTRLGNTYNFDERYVDAAG